MCYKKVCSKCKKATWKGCGFHIDSALAGVHEIDRCMGWKKGVCIMPAATSQGYTSNNVSSSSDDCKNGGDGTSVDTNTGTEGNNTCSMG